MWNPFRSYRPSVALEMVARQAKEKLLIDDTIRPWRCRIRRATVARPAVERRVGLQRKAGCYMTIVKLRCGK
jgi:hypothetical protein